MEPQCNVRLQAFEGPLDLLLHLIVKNRLDIADIPIALVTSQYLQYLELMKALDVVVAGEYLVMAARLMHIKSRMLLPVSREEEEEEDPRMEIVRPLTELIQAREAATELMSRPLLDRDVFTGSAHPTGVDQEEIGKGAPIEVGLHQLLSAFMDVLGRRSIPRALEIERARASVQERMEELAAMIARKGRLFFFELLSWTERYMVVVTFLALLELAKLGKVGLYQEECGGDITIVPGRAAGHS